MSSLHHAGLTVADLDRAVAFYREVCGLAVRDRFTVDGESFATGVGVPDAAGRFAHLAGEDTRLELVEYEPAGDTLDTPAINRPGTPHIGVEVADLDVFYADLPADVATVSEPQTTTSGTRILFLRDPEGNLVEILEPA